jgi:hypothetical protein
LPVNRGETAYKPAYKKLTENAYSISNQSSLIDSKATVEQSQISKLVECDMSLKSGMLGGENNQLPLIDTQENQRSRKALFPFCHIILKAPKPLSIKRLKAVYKAKQGFIKIIFSEGANPYSVSFLPYKTNKTYT